MCDVIGRKVMASAISERYCATVSRPSSDGPYVFLTYTFFAKLDIFYKIIEHKIKCNVTSKGPSIKEPKHVIKKLDIGFDRRVRNPKTVDLLSFV